MHFRSESSSPPAAIAWLFPALAALVACGGGGQPRADGTLVVTPARAERLDLEDGTIVDVPAGAVASQITLTASSLATPSAPVGMVLVSKMLRMGPEGQAFLEPVDIGLSFDPTQLPSGATADDVVVLRAPSGTTAFVPIPTRRGAGAVTVIGSTEHFSDFVAAVPTGSTPMACGNGTCAAVESCSSCPVDCGLCPPVTPATTRDELVAQLSARFDEDYGICYGNGVVTTGASSEGQRWFGNVLGRDALADGVIQIDFARANHSLDAIRAWPRCATDPFAVYAAALYGSVRGVDAEDNWVGLANQGGSCSDSSWCALGLHCVHGADACAGTCQTVLAFALGARCRAHSDCAPTATAGVFVVCAPGSGGFDVCQEQSAPTPQVLGGECIDPDSNAVLVMRGLIRRGCGADAYCESNGSGFVDGVFLDDAGVCVSFPDAGQTCDPDGGGAWAGVSMSCSETAPGSGSFVLYPKTITTVAGGACDYYGDAVGRGARECGDGLECSSVDTCQSLACWLDDHCSTGLFCDWVGQGRACVARKSNGGSCDTGSACVSGYCDVNVTATCLALPVRNATPSSAESCNGEDDDCDGSADDGLATQTVYADVDQDGYYPPGAAPLLLCGTWSGLSVLGGDCDPEDDRVSPGVTEVPGNGLDDDCNPATSD